MANSELRKQLNELAEDFVAGVLRAIQSVPLAQLATGVSEASQGRGRRAAAGAKPAASGAKKGAAKSKAAAGGGKRKLSRRSPESLGELRGNILKVLRGASGPIGAAEIARQVGGGVKTPDLSFPLSQLRSQKLVSKQGERTQAVYAITERGRSEGPTDRRKGRGGAKKGAAKKSAGSAKKGAAKKSSSKAAAKPTPKPAPEG